MSFPSKYVCDKNTLKVTLAEYGVAIIPRVINDIECESMLSGMFDYFEHITKGWEVPFDRSNPNSIKSIYNLYPKHASLYQHYEVGHSQCVWDMRQNKKIIDIFSTLWECKDEELLVSFDGMTLAPPPERTNRGWKGKDWFHCDQSFRRNNDLECVQSWVTALDVEQGDSTLMVYEKSHLFHKEFQETFNIGTKVDWRKLNEQEEKFYKDKGCEMATVYCPKGSMVFWDSRTIHSGKGADRGRQSANMRAVIYLCYTPRILATKKQLEKKQKAFKENRTTSHWPHKIKLFAKEARTYGNPKPAINRIENPVVNELGMKMAGF